MFGSVIMKSYLASCSYEEVWNSYLASCSYEEVWNACNVAYIVYTSSTHAYMPRRIY